MSTARLTIGSVHDARVIDNLIREDGRAIYSDEGYANEKKKRLAQDGGVVWAGLSNVVAH